MKIVVIALLTLFALTIAAALKAARRADDYAELMRDFEEEK
jgi:hypothetical protein